MDSHIALIGSITIGSLFLLGVMNFYSGLVDHSTEKNIELLTQQTAAGVMEIIDYDVSRMGSGVSTPSAAITNLSDTTDITFQADVDPTIAGPELIRYQLGGPAGYTENPKDSILYRYVNGTEVMKLAGVRKFSVKLRDHTSTVTTNQSDASIIEIMLLLESTYGYQKLGFSDTKYARAFWRKIITPKNMIRQTNMDFD